VGADVAAWKWRRWRTGGRNGLSTGSRLAEVACEVGLTRLHFAARFKAATGLRPHEYLLRRRIERAREMLVDARLSSVENALSVGFQTQSHFTNVFRRFVGQPPLAWRESRDRGQIAVGATCSFIDCIKPAFA
jgi:AraC family transcriptional regulator